MLLEMMKNKDGQKLSTEDTLGVYTVALCILFSFALVGLFLVFAVQGLIAAGLHNSMGIILGVIVFIWLLRMIARIIVRRNWYDV